MALSGGCWVPRHRDLYWLRLAVCAYVALRYQVECGDFHRDLLCLFAVP